MNRSSRTRLSLPAIHRRFAGLTAGLWTIVILMAVCEGEVPSPSGGPVFERDVLPLLTARGCNAGGCHGKSGGQNGFALSLLGFDPDGDYRAILMQSRGRRVNDAAPGDSLLVLKGMAAVPHGGGRRLDPGGEDVRLLVEWIATGAPRLAADAPRLSHITIAPVSRPLAPSEAIRLQVTAHDTDGSSRDVTDLAAYSSSEPVVADVQPDGTLSAGRLPGEATIMARFMGRIATWNATVPRPGSIDPSVWDSLPSNGLIDDIAWKHFRTLNILPSEACDDATFLRRAFLDAIGRLPTAEEAAAFLADTDPARRERLVDGLVTRTDYADRWANAWADLLRPNPYRVGIKATLALDTFLRDAFASNMPYDRFVAELLTATGSVWRNGAAVIYRDRRSPDEIVTMASQLFLGVRLECAKCHQHPFEVYGQRDFYSLAAYFGRVGQTGFLSPPISGAEESVFVKESGEVRHPLTSEVLAPAPPGAAPTRAANGGDAVLAEGDDPRQRLVEWLSGPGSATLAAAGVNRVWAELFGIGLVDPPDDFRATNPPSNPQMLSALAEAFRQSGYDHRALVAMIMKSRLYGLSSIPNATNAGDHRHFSRRYRRRLRAEVLADAIDDVTGVPSSYPGTPPGTRAAQVWTHRSVSTFLDVFGRPDPNQDPPCERIGEATVVQALHLMNGGHVHSKVTADDSLPARLAAAASNPGGSSAPASAAEAAAGIVDRLYLTAYARYPTAAEKARVFPEFSRENRSLRQVAEDVLWAMLNSPEFVYTH